MSDIKMEKAKGTLLNQFPESALELRFNPTMIDSSLDTVKKYFWFNL